MYLYVNRTGMHDSYVNLDLIVEASFYGTPLPDGAVAVLVSSNGREERIWERKQADAVREYVMERQLLITEPEEIDADM